VKTIQSVQLDLTPSLGQEHGHPGSSHQILSFAQPTGMKIPIVSLIVHIGRKSISNAQQTTHQTKGGTRLFHGPQRIIFQPMACPFLSLREVIHTILMGTSSPHWETLGIRKEILSKLQPLLSKACCNTLWDHPRRRAAVFPLL